MPSLSIVPGVTTPYIMQAVRQLCKVRNDNRSLRTSITSHLIRLPLFGLLLADGYQNVAKQTANSYGQPCTNLGNKVRANLVDNVFALKRIKVSM